MKILIVEDDFAGRKLLHRYLESVGECELVIDGQEAIDAFSYALEKGVPYDLVCLDIMLPKKDGQQVLKEIRKIEEDKGLHGLNGVKIIMITALNDAQNIIQAFRAQCEGYITKPLKRDKLIEEIEKLGLPVK